MRHQHRWHPDFRSTNDQHRPSRHHARDFAKSTATVTVTAATTDTRNEQRDGLATDPFGNLRAGFEGAVTINRKDYNISWYAALETGGVLVSDKIVLEFEVSAINNA